MNTIYWLWYDIETELRWLWTEFAPVIVIFVLAFVYAFGISTAKFFENRKRSK